jgi:hypothetical protein
MLERADIAQLLISRQGKFFAGEFLMAVDLQHLRRVHKQNSSLACQAVVRRLRDKGWSLAGSLLN